MLRGGQRYSGTKGGSRTSGLLSLFFAIAIAGCASFILSPSDRILEGRANATDGDSIRIDNVRIRIKGIDAPELNQTCQRGKQTYLCGEMARDALLSLILRNKVKCRSAGRDKYKRILAKCSVGDVDIGAHMVSSGWAVSYGDYAREQDKAEVRRAGLWAGTFDLPREWRKLHPTNS